MYPQIDLSRMLEHPICAVYVATQEQANAIIHNARTQFPERITDSWDANGNYWSDYGEETAYTLFFEDEDEPTTMSYGDVPWFNAEGYVVIEYEELLAETIEIAEGDQPIGLLLGGVV